MQVAPDWSQDFGPEDFEREMKMKFEGPGFYLTAGDTMLIVPNHASTTPDNVWHLKDAKPDHTLYTVHVYNCPLSQTIFAVIALAPVRMDKRVPPLDLPKDYTPTPGDNEEPID